MSLLYDGGASEKVVLCELCADEKQEAKYSCSRCGKRYCSLKCFKSKLHQSCSEDFYEKEVKESMKVPDKGSDKEKLKLIGILDKYQDGEEWKYEAPLNYNKVEDELNVSRQDLDELQDQITTEDEYELDELIENATPDQLLKLMTPEERHRFEELLNSGKYEITE